MNEAPFNPELTEQELAEFRKREEMFEHNGCRIWLRDFTNLDGDTATKFVLWLADENAARNKHDLLVLTDVTGAWGNKETIAAFKQATVRSKRFYNKVAVVGTVGVVRFFLDIVVRFSKIENVMAFDTREEALEWLTS